MPKKPDKKASKIPDAPPKKGARITLRLPDDTRDRLLKLARRRKRSENFVALELIEEALPRAERRRYAGD